MKETASDRQKSKLSADRSVAKRGVVSTDLEKVREKGHQGIGATTRRRLHEKSFMRITWWQKLSGVYSVSGAGRITDVTTRYWWTTRSFLGGVGEDEVGSKGRGERSGGRFGNPLVIAQLTGRGIGKWAWTACCFTDALTDNWNPS